MVKIIVLGSGLVGGPMALDLAADAGMNVTVADRDKNAFQKIAGNSGIITVESDLSDPGRVKDLVRDYDFVVNAVPGFMGFQTLKALVDAGKNVIDIAFFPENVLELDELAKKRNVTVISDIGVAPGMSNLLVGYADHLLDETEDVKIYVGGLPRVREWPFEYKAVFSPVDVIEEYTRPARYIANGKMVVKPALSEPELIDFEGVGTLEAFNSDGLRSLAETIKAPNMIEKTLRYPGHIEIMKVFRETGFFHKEELTVGDVKISPLEFTSRLLFPKWKMRQGDEDLTVMKIIVEGKKDGHKLRYTFDLLDYFDRASGIHSMARTTGYTATMALRMLVNGLYDEKGVSVPEFIGKKPECVRFILEGLSEKGINYRESVEDI
ncbi:MAG: saccharopine dehydrogenase NADP-binding domain-containing protein [Prolixibacteraceae bacterium]|nr:saccharopine dehydrogenase NADP-binding domain-containing protein [Prolixibacteraceae bacterium]